ncbi:MAG: hypothetical protein AB1595_01115 [bacterium]
MACDGQIIYDSKDKTLKPIAPSTLSIAFDDKSPAYLETLTLNFLTPTRILHNGHLTLKLDFHSKIEDNSPITLSITCSKIKFPFFQHWELLDKPKAKPINVYLINTSPPLEVDFAQLDKLMGSENIEGINTLLHRLVKIEERTKSRMTFEMVILEDRHRLKDLYKYFVTGELSSKDILAYQKIVGDRDE